MTREFAVALSFAREQEGYVRAVAKSLDERGIRFFLADLEVASMWGRDLGTFLSEVFLERSQFVMVFVSKDFVERVWTNWEFRSALAHEQARFHS